MLVNHGICFSSKFVAIIGNAGMTKHYLNYIIALLVDDVVELGRGVVNMVSGVLSIVPFVQYLFEVASPLAFSSLFM